MVRQKVKLANTLLFSADVLATIVSFIVAYWVRVNFAEDFSLPLLHPIETYYWVLISAIVVLTAQLYKKSTSVYNRNRSFAREFKELMKVIVVITLVIGLIAFVFQIHYLSRLFIGLFIVINAIILTSERIIVRIITRNIRKKGFDFRNIVIVGVNESSLNFSEVAKRHTSWGLKVVGFVSGGDEVKENTKEDINLLGSMEELEAIVTDNNIDEVVFAITKDKIGEMEDTFLMLEDQGITVRVIVDFFPNVMSKVYVEELEDIPLLSFATTPNDGLALFVKRCFDIVVSLILIVLSSPIMVLSAIIIKTSSRGPVLFKHKRTGLYGRKFEMYKFRSMSMDAESKVGELQGSNEMTGPMFKISNDPRITSFGRFIRRFSIDELPQFFNILKGDMSIVGPRPSVATDEDRYKRWQRRRLSMKPGLTCLWQISGRSHLTDFDDLVKLDLYYIDNWSLGLDFRIFLKTVPVVIFGKGAT